MTLARRHFEQASAAASEGTDLSALTAYQRLYKRLKDDKAVLKNIASIADKKQAKAAMLPAYCEWLTGVVEKGRAAAGDTLTPTLLVWLIDAGELDEAMPLARLAVATGMASGDEYSRTLPEIIVEESADAITKGADISPENLQTLIEWASGKASDGMHAVNLPDPVRAKLLKAAGETAEKQGDADQALALYIAADGYHARVGVKKRIAALKKQQEN